MAPTQEPKATRKRAEKPLDPSKGRKGYVCHICVPERNLDPNTYQLMLVHECMEHGQTLHQVSEEGLPEFLHRSYYEVQFSHECILAKPKTTRPAGVPKRKYTRRKTVGQAASQTTAQAAENLPDESAMQFIEQMFNGDGGNPDINGNAASASDDDDVYHEYILLPEGHTHIPQMTASTMNQAAQMAFGEQTGLVPVDGTFQMDHNPTTFDTQVDFTGMGDLSGDFFDMAQGQDYFFPEWAHQDQTDTQDMSGTHQYLGSQMDVALMAGFESPAPRSRVSSGGLANYAPGFASHNGTSPVGTSQVGSSQVDSSQGDSPHYVASFNGNPGSLSSPLSGPPSTPHLSSTPRMTPMEFRDPTSKSSPARQRLSENPQFEPAISVHGDVIRAAGEARLALSRAQQAAGIPRAQRRGTMGLPLTAANYAAAGMPNIVVPKAARRNSKQQRRSRAVTAPKTPSPVVAPAPASVAPATPGSAAPLEQPSREYVSPYQQRPSAHADLDRFFDFDEPASQPSTVPSAVAGMDGAVDTPQPPAVESAAASPGPITAPAQDMGAVMAFMEQQLAAHRAEVAMQFEELKKKAEKAEMEKAALEAELAKEKERGALLHQQPAAPAAEVEEPQLSVLAAEFAGAASPLESSGAWEDWINWGD